MRNVKLRAEFTMPNACYFCPFKQKYADWCWLLKRDIMGAHMYREKDCPLVEIKEEENTWEQ